MLCVYIYFYLQHARNWVSSGNPLDTRERDYSEVPCVSAGNAHNTLCVVHVAILFCRLNSGTTKHVETSWKSFESVFQYFADQEESKDDKKSPKKKATPTKKDKSGKVSGTTTAAAGKQQTKLKSPKKSSSKKAQSSETSILESPEKLQSPKIESLEKSQSPEATKSKSPENSPLPAESPRLDNAA